MTPNPFYPRWIDCLDGAQRIVKDPREHESFTGIPRNDDGTPREDSEQAPVPAAVTRRGRPAKKAPDSAPVVEPVPVDVDPLADPLGATVEDGDVHPA